MVDKNEKRFLVINFQLYIMNAKNKVKSWKITIILGINQSHGINAGSVISLATMALSLTRVNYLELENSLKLQLIPA